jgi:hypothetical protein
MIFFPVDATGDEVQVADTEPDFGPQSNGVVHQPVLLDSAEGKAAQDTEAETHVRIRAPWHPGSCEGRRHPQLGAERLRLGHAIGPPGLLQRDELRPLLSNCRQVRLVMLPRIGLDVMFPHAAPVPRPAGERQ